jgi:heme-degrading monooxygenase HmoA
MAYTLIHHNLARYQDFEAVFKDDGERRRRLGSKGAKVFADAQDPQNIFTLIEWDDIESAEKFAGGWETREAIEWATSGRHASEIWVIENRLEMEV